MYLINWKKASQKNFFRFSIFADNSRADPTTTSKEKISFSLKLFTGQRIMYKIHCVEQIITCLVLYSRKLFLIPLPLFSRSGWGHSTPHILSTAYDYLGYRDNYHKIKISFLEIFVCHCFNWNKPESQLIAELILHNEKILRDIIILFWFTKLLWFQYKEHKVCLTKIPTYISSK